MTMNDIFLSDGDETSNFIGSNQSRGYSIFLFIDWSVNKLLLLRLQALHKKTLHK